MKLALVAVLLAACNGAGTPAPIDKGKCLVEMYSGARPIRETCTYSGYRWDCMWSDNSEAYLCTRTGEAGGTRTP